MKWICSGCRDVVTSTIFEDGHILAGTFAWLSVIEIILKTFIGRQAVLINCLTRLHFGGSVFSQKCREKRVLECSCQNTLAIFLWSIWLKYAHLGIVSWQVKCRSCLWPLKKWQSYWKFCKWCNKHGFRWLQLSVKVWIFWYTQPPRLPCPSSSQNLPHWVSAKFWHRWASLFLSHFLFMCWLN